MAPTLLASRSTLPPEGALRLRPGKAGSAAPAGEEKTSTLIASRSTQPPEVYSDRPELVEGWGGPAENFRSTIG